MSQGGTKLFLRCGGKECAQLFERKVSDISVCHDKGASYFSLYGRCPDSRCSHENFVRGDEFQERLLRLSCPECGDKSPVLAFDWRREKVLSLTFSGSCERCGKKLSLIWSL